MLNCTVTRGELRLKDNHQPEFEITGIVGLSGKAAGTVVLSLSREVAFAATEAFLGDKPTDISADVVDAVGEITNMIAGGAKAQLEKFAMSLGLPTVVAG